MSRHRKVKALDYDEEYDDYYGELDDDDFDEGAFEAQYLSSGIDLNNSESNNTNEFSKNSSTKFNDEVQSNDLTSNSDKQLNQKVSKTTHLESTSNIRNENSHGFLLSNEDKFESITTKNEKIFESSPEHKLDADSISSNLTKLAIQHLDRHQWQLPLMEMDKKFRDKTYYKHYTDTYISSLRSKLGHFLADNQLLQNPMKYHVRQELDNYGKYSRMFELLTDYYQSLGSGFFSFATPSPDEEIVIGCRLGTKAKKQPTKKNQPAKNETQEKAARFEYHGKPAKSTLSSTKPKQKSENSDTLLSDNDSSKDLTIRENFTAEQLSNLAKKYQNSLKFDDKKPSRRPDEPGKLDSTIASKVNTVKYTKGNTLNTTKKEGSSSKIQKNQPKQLKTLTERRDHLKRQLRRNAEPSAKDLEIFNKQAQQIANEYKELVRNSRSSINLVVVGHVDAGKSTLVGHLLYKLGQISGKQMHRMEVDSQRSGKASFKYAWAMDETEEERARGVTIDIALTKFQTSSKDVVLLDAPGHVDFIPAVISGAAQADSALLVVDATRGEFETGFNAGGQTREHTFLVRSLGVKSIIVVVNKMDNVNWSWARFSDIVDQLKPFLKQAGFNLKTEVQFVVCSGLTGENIVDKRIDKVKKDSCHPQLEGDGGNWDTIPSLIEAIDKIKEPERMVDKPTRVCVTDVFKGMSSGVFLGGKVVSGRIEGKQKLILLPPGETCEIKQVEVRDTKESRAFAGHIVTAVVVGVDMNKFYRGCMLCDPIFPCKVTNRFQARVIMFQNSDVVLLKGTPIEVHINGIHESGEIRRLISLLNKNTGELIQNKPRCIVRNASAIIQLKLAQVVCCELYGDNKDLGRFMIRSYGKTIAAGLITKIKSAKLYKNKTKLKSK